MATAVVYAQQDAQWSHFQFNQQYYNPGYVGLDQTTRATLLHRTQWLGYETTIVDDQKGGAPSQQQIALMQPIRIKSKAINSGINIAPKNFAWDAEMPVNPDANGLYPVAIPGVTKFV